MRAGVMGWQTLSQRVNAGKIPLVLAGPIVRRVTPTSASVWIALREPAKVRLFIKKATSGTTLAQVQNQPLHTSSVVTPICLGEHTYVTVVTAWIPASTPLQAGATYIYSLHFTYPDGSTKWLGDSGVLKMGAPGIDLICYPDFAGPTFVLPAAQPNGLRFAHGSCRKPHGESVDALMAIDGILETTCGTSQRPQQLFLTGDQIYADDVADTLLYMLRDTHSWLFNWTETLPVALTADQKRPGGRQALIKQLQLSSKAARSHLIEAQEFYAMYLFVWSDVLWPDDLPDKKVIYNKSAADLATFKGALDPDKFGQEQRNLRHFQSILPYVRRALANIATYMIFDDHEITDDWFLSLRWCNAALQNPYLGRTILRNGLAAYLAFQHWGNAPAYFAANGAGFAALSKLNLPLVQGSAYTTALPGLAEDLLPNAVSVTSTLELFALTEKLAWHYKIAFPAYTLVVLDTRTRRGFTTGGKHVNLICKTALAQQLPTGPSTSGLTIVVSPTPVLGHSIIEKGFDGAVTATGLAESILPHTTATTARYQVQQNLDYEAWAYHSGAFGHLLRQLSPLGRVIVLSGDVHYGFSKSASHWSANTLANGALSLGVSCIVQLCCSSLKNTGSAPRAASAVDNIVDIVEFGKVLGDVGETAGLFVKALSNPALGCTLLARSMFKTSLEAEFSSGPLARFLVNEISDKRLLGPREVNPLQSSANDRKTFSLRHMSASLYQNTVVCSNNLGLVAVTWTNAVQKLEHKFYWCQEPNLNSTPADFSPHTIHEVPLSMPTKPVQWAAP